MISCRSQVYKLVQELHSIGIIHGDLDPRNIVRAYGGGFRLIDFSESRRHICKESKVRYMSTMLCLLLTFKLDQPRRIAYSFHSGPKSEVFRTANVTKLVVETVGASSRPCKFEMKDVQDKVKFPTEFEALNLLAEVAPVKVYLSCLLRIVFSVKNFAYFSS